MRIVTGKYKGRRFDIPGTFKARPTTDFAKESIFNVLNGYVDFGGSKCLDLFAGTGAITLEMLSRGAQTVVSVELERDHHAFICRCLEKLGATNGVPIRGDVFRFAKSCKQQFDVIFADPPYNLPQLETIPDMILRHGLLYEGGVLVFEHGKKNDFSGHPNFVEHRAYGSVNFTIFRPTALT